ncbi:MSMEG_0565 family glycosyltransferase [Methylomonas sp. LW13]|uniref:MSMEG_0565 family glycosyltransferase n=1 Tax=unclassified Methylomonas TaxID=2608980 RepID=UPI00051BDF35|nr:MULTISPECIES: MSMEG_0565 family glycosyltransferase [unclassified Methylomonas]PKD41394.1 MSMEG_0565 family glycosyltransferase [Methylomonas sp. Kb3]QBC27086.1 MSMEG_0565 family glycosyltransferase [Methylomonas sp. LW13]
MPRLRIAMLTHSVNPRGGVVHAMQLAEALQELGHDVTLIAAAEPGKKFFRAVRCRTTLIPLTRLSGDLVATVGQRIQAYIDYFSQSATTTFDIYHAQDAISGCAMAELSERGIIDGFVRTVHHLDSFDDVSLMTWQSRSFVAAQRVLCVSRDWQDKLHKQHRIAATQVNNGVDVQRYSPVPHAHDETLRQSLGLSRGGPIFLAVGGIEARKNTLRIFAAFREVLQQRPNTQLIIVGGASLLDHSDYRQQFNAAVAESAIQEGHGQPLIITGPLPDADMPSLFRLADALVFPSLTEGFGLVVLEAILSGTPAIVSLRPPFTDYLQDQDCIWTDPEDSAAISIAMKTAIDDFPKARLPTIAQRLSSEFSWVQSANTHLEIYRSLINAQGTHYA